MGPTQTPQPQLPTPVLALQRVRSNSASPNATPQRHVRAQPSLQQTRRRPRQQRQRALSLPQNRNSRRRRTTWLLRRRQLKVCRQKSAQRVRLLQQRLQ